MKPLPHVAADGPAAHQTTRSAHESIIGQSCRYRSIDLRERRRNALLTSREIINYHYFTLLCLLLAFYQFYDLFNGAIKLLRPSLNYRLFNGRLRFFHARPQRKKSWYSHRNHSTAQAGVLILPSGQYERCCHDNADICRITLQEVAVVVATKMNKNLAMKARAQKNPRS